MTTVPWLTILWLLPLIGAAINGLLGKRLVFTVHNAVPHGFAGLQHPFTRRLAERV